MNVTVAAEYATKHGLQALLVGRDADVLFERYGPGFDAQTAHPLYSGTKSFWGVAAVAAHVDGLLSLDEPVSATFADWRHGSKSRVTLVHLLQLTSGIGFGGLGNAVPTFSAARDVVLKDEPGDRFTYGGIPLQVFGAVLAEKLRGRGQNPQAYLVELVLKRPLERPTFPEGDDPEGRPYRDLRWSMFKSFEPREMFTVVDRHVFPFLQRLGGEGSAFAQHMKDARLAIPTPALFQRPSRRSTALRHRRRRNLPTLRRANSRFCASSSTDSPIKRSRSVWSSVRARSKCTSSASWASSTRARVREPSRKQFV